MPYITHQGEARLVGAGLLNGDVEVELLRMALCLGSFGARARAWARVTARGEEIGVRVM